MNAVEAFDSLEHNTLLLLKSVHIHPEYKNLLDELLEEISVIAAPSFSRHYTRPILTIILASPGRLTPYHIDDSENLLFQIHGTKKFFVFDGSDRSIVTARDLETYWATGSSNLKYSDEVQAKATEYSLGPGLGVHVPLTFPHWAQNNNNISVAVSVNFQQLSCSQSIISRANFKLREWGFNPRELGENQIADMVKCAAFPKAFALWQSLRRLGL
jgi:hypothetical protein